MGVPGCRWVLVIQTTVVELEVYLLDTIGLSTYLPGLLHLATFDFGVRTRKAIADMFAN